MNQERAKNIGVYIKNRRLERQLSTRSLETKAGVGRGVVSRIETGQRLPSPDMLRAIAVALDAPLVEMFIKAGYLLPDDLTELRSYLAADDSAD